MPTISDQIEDLYRMVDTDAGKVNVLTQIQVIGNGVTALEARYDNLLAQHAQLEEEHTNLKDSQTNELAVIGTFGGEDTDLPEQQANILRTLVAGKMELPAIAQALKVSLEHAKYHVHELREANMIGVNSYIGRPSNYYLLQNGRGYLIKRGEL